MNVLISNSQLKGILDIPSSKSAMQRACAAALLNIGTTEITNPGKSQDDLAALSIIQQLGATIEEKNNKLIITSDGIEGLREKKVDSIDCGESGLSVRMFTPIAALTSHPVTITGRGSLNKRPLTFFDETLPSLQVSIQSHNGFLPLKIHGPLIPQDIKVDGSLSSQYITGLLMAYSVSTQSTTQLQVDQPASIPYIELTLSVMQQFEMNSPQVERLEHFTFSPYQAEKKNILFSVESDWSSASFFIVGGAIAGDLTLKGLNSFSTQADASILEVLDDAHVDYELDDDDTLHIRKTDNITAFDFDATDSPDLFPPLVVLSAFAKGTSRISGTQRLIHKESNRLETLMKEFRKLGVDITHENDSLVINGADAILGGKCGSHNDHRIAMALGMMALRSQSPIEIEEAECVRKSYPDFWEHMILLGADIKYL